MDRIVTQGLGARFLVSQGWLGGPSPSLINQGLGGPRILLQGLVGSGGLAVASPSGGLCVGGRFGTRGVSAWDTFTDLAGTALSAHAPGSGGSWTQHPSAPGTAVITSSGRARGAGISATSVYCQSATPADADYTVSADVYVATSAGSAGVLGRLSPTADTCYFARCNASQLELGRHVAGVETILATAATSWAPGQTHRIALVLQGQAVALWADGAPACGPVSDPAIAAPGRAGVTFRTADLAGTDLRYIHVDNWQVVGCNGLVNYAPGAAGGAQIGGRTVPLHVQHPLASGGLSLGGARALTAHLIVSPSGGPGFGGTSGSSLIPTIKGSGGLARGGRLAPLVALRPSPRGGTVSGGSSGPTAAVHALACGHVGLGGSGPASTAITILAGGGLALGGWQSVVAGAGYHIYANTGTGDAINYATCLATVTGQSWTSSTLEAPAHFKLGVRAFERSTGQEEENIDAVVELILDAAGRDVTGVPAPPLGLRAFPIAGGKIRLEWTHPGGPPSRQPLGFRVYVGTGPVADYSLPALTVDWTSARFGCFSAELGGLGSGSPRSIAVRSYNAVAEEQNTTVLVVTPDGSPPSVVDALQAVATNQEP